MATRSTPKKKEQNTEQADQALNDKPLVSIEEVAAEPPKKPATRKPRTPKAAQPVAEATDVIEEKSPETGAKKPSSTTKRSTGTTTRRSTKSETASEGESTAPKPTAKSATEEESTTPKRTTKKAAKPKEVPEQPPEAERQGNLPVIIDIPQDVTDSAVPISFPEAEKRNLVGRALSLLLVLGIIGLAVLIFFFRPNSYDEKTSAINFLYQKERNVTLIAQNGAVIGEVGGTCAFSTHDATGDTAAAIIGGKLYLIDKKTVSELASEVNDCVLSANGKALAWRTQNANLYYLAIGKKNGQYHMSQRTYDAHYALSPDGKELFYTFEQDGIVRIDVYSRSGNKPYLSDNRGYYPVAVADACRYLYYTDAKGSLYVLSTKADRITRCCDTPDFSTLIFNRDCSQMLVYDGAEMRMFVDGERYALPDVGDGDHLMLQANRRVSVLPAQVGTRYLVDSFFDNYYLHDTGGEQRLVYLQKGKEHGVVTLCSLVDGEAGVTVTDKSVFFLHTAQETTATHTNLYRCRAGKTEKESLCWDVQSYVTNVDGSRLLYADVHGALFSMRVGVGTQRLCDTFMLESLSVSADDTFYFCRAEGELMASDNGETPRVLAEDVNLFLVDGMTLYYFVGPLDEGKVAYANYRNMRKSTMIADGITAAQ